MKSETKKRSDRRPRVMVQRRLSKSNLFHRFASRL